MLNARYRLIDQTGDLMHYRSTKSPVFNVTRFESLQLGKYSSHIFVWHWHRFGGHPAEPQTDFKVSFSWSVYYILKKSTIMHLSPGETSCNSCISSWASSQNSSIFPSTPIHEDEDEDEDVLPPSAVWKLSRVSGWVQSEACKSWCPFLYTQPLSGHHSGLTDSLFVPSPAS